MPRKTRRSAYVRKSKSTKPYTDVPAEYKGSSLSEGELKAAVDAVVPNGSTDDTVPGSPPALVGMPSQSQLRAIAAEVIASSPVVAAALDAMDESVDTPLKKVVGEPAYEASLGSMSPPRLQRQAAHGSDLVSLMEKKDEELSSLIPSRGTKRSVTFETPMGEKSYRVRKRAKFTPMSEVDMSEFFDQKSLSYILTPRDRYNRRLRHMIRSARAIPSGSLNPFIVDGMFRVLKDGVVRALPTNGRNATRYEGAAMDRGLKVMRAVDELELYNVGVSFLNDLGYGSTVAREILRKHMEQVKEKAENEEAIDEIIEEFMGPSVDLTKG